MNNDALHHQELARPGSWLGHTVVVEPVTASTNDEARRLAEAGAKTGVVVIAERQERGRGRQGRRWQSPGGVNLLFSVLLREPDLGPVAGLVTLAAGLAVARAVAGHCGLPARIKWPNDVRIGGRKLCGILAEAGGSHRVEYIVVGIGLNVNVVREDLPAELQDLATSLRMETNRPWRRAEVFRAVMAELETVLSELKDGGVERVLSSWKVYDEVLGHRVRAETPGGVFHGLAIDLRPDGALILRDEATGREQAVVAGDVTPMPLAT
jgi:BirA family transcriptional regulator, biotin operon repressor / biotin---[acetyl-CoA-carboxylase] ligase